MRSRITVILLLLTLCPVYCIAGPEAKYTLKVVDEKGQPIEGAEVVANFTGSKAKIMKGKTDKNGLFTASGKTGPIFGAYVDKEGYYRSGSGVSKLLKHGENFSQRWEPWNPTIEVVLKEKKNPIPMYAKGTFGYIKIPALDIPIAYDLEIGDWLAPYGKGTIADFIFTCKVRYDGIKDWETAYHLTFSNNNDGIMEYYPEDNNSGEFPWPYEAPESGYKANIDLVESLNPEDGYKTNYDEKRRYFFRVRTRTDLQGNIIEAKYGKMTGDIIVTRKGNIGFCYYLNPTGTRNLEFSGENLFTSDKNKYPY